MKLTPTLCILALSLLTTATRAQTSSEPSLPYSPSLNLESIDKSIDPCVNLYQYCVRPLAKGESDPGGSDFLGRLRQAV